MQPRRSVLLAAIALGAIGAGLASDAGYMAGVAQWRKSHDRDIRSEKGPLWLIGRHNLAEGRIEIGADASNRVQLPSRAPKRIGAIERRADKVTFEPAPGIEVKVNGKPVTGLVALRTGIAPEPNDRIACGDFEFAAGCGDGACQLVIRDRQSDFFKAFQGAVWFPISATYRVEAVFTPYPQPKEMKIPDTSGRTRTSQAPGYATFQLNGEALRLEPVTTPNGLFFMFRDRTSAKETYGAGRYLETEMPKGGKVVLDFNKAYNPYCAFNPYSSCPIPPRQNTMTTRVEAGEKYRGEH